MRLSRFAFVAATAWLAANHLMKNRRAGAPDGPDAPRGSDLPVLHDVLDSRDAPSTLTNPVAGSVLDSPNDAERLQASGVAATPAADAPGGEDFASTSQESGDARAPGLPDFFRGA